MSYIDGVDPTHEIGMDRLDPYNSGEILLDDLGLVLQDLIANNELPRYVGSEVTQEYNSDRTEVTGTIIFATREGAEKYKSAIEYVPSTISVTIIED
jgi:hypothetical protein